jgi:hypothetical protein
MAYGKTEISKDAWINNVAIPAELQPLWSARQEAAQAAQEAREAFEAEFTAYMRANGLAADKALAFNYRFGQLSVAQVARTAPRPVSTGKKQTDLAAFFASQLGNGRRI